MRHFKNIHVGKSTIVLSNVPNLARPAPIKADPDNLGIESAMVPWGSDNLYPINFYNKKYLRNGAVVGGMTALKASLYGNGFTLVKYIEKDGDLVPQKQSIHKYPDIRTFARLSNFNRFWYEMFTDQSVFHISFIEYILSQDKKSIARVKRLQAAHCRFGEQDKTGVSRKVFLNTDWENANPKYTLTFDYMHPDMSVEEIKEYCLEKGLDRFVSSTFYPLVTESFYPQTDWHAPDRNGWIDTANSVPEMKQAILENQLHFKYIVYISDFYFESFYKEEWDDFDSDKRQQLREELATVIDDHMSGVKAAGRSLVSPIFEENGKFVKGIEVTPVDNKLKDGSLLVDAAAANSEILFAMGVDPSIIGAGIPGGSNLSGSGSDKREAYTILCANLTPRRHLALEVWERIRDFNEWPPELEATFPNINLTTLDKNPDGQTEIIN